MSAGAGWGVVVEAPGEEAGLAAMLGEVAEAVKAGAVLVAVQGGSAFTRMLITEEVRLVHGCPSLLVDPDFDRDRAITAVLAGRADLVGADAGSVACWGEPG